MDLNSDFSKRAIVHAGSMDWKASPMPGVDRRMLDRMGGEVARATSIVRYAAGSHFSEHTHTGGEEFLVLDGVFQDEHGDFPAGTYVRNPPTTAHTPGSKEGCTILVKLWQFDMDDRNQFHIDTTSAEFSPVAGANGVERLTLHEDARETVRMENWEVGADVPVDAPGGIEILVLDGSFTIDSETFVPQSWLRLPKGDQLVATAGSEGARVWIKSGHLAQAPQPQSA
ncbi:cupin domain-containing protein [Ahrensia sp. R2A130]|uniref:cupin domain-containing protein n=1 Tax=Ahrensia sp. R2A130 TaxID=744979 RepID=UPI0001E08BF2|nr:cupin domain-containing protein [Ahrensia sp. R2A130]EFL89954.1 Anti-sigma factor, ChrR [Ahrensia sp. R2A130]